jgi:hypothetical protein
VGTSSFYTPARCLLKGLVPVREKRAVTVNIEIAIDPSMASQFMGSYHLLTIIMTRSQKMTEFKSLRVEKRYTMTLCADPEIVFPLLCPVREYEWIEPWACEMIYSETGVAENNAVFKTNFPQQGGEEIWVVCRYEKNRAIEFIRLAPDLKVNRLDIRLTAGAKGTLATWTNTYTGLSESGNQWIRNLTDDFFLTEKKAIEKMLNHYLKKGSILSIGDLNLENESHGQTANY